MDDLAENLLKLEYNDVKNKLTFEGMTTLAKVVKVYDGDTITLIWKYMGQYLKYSCRMVGYDAPEIKRNKRIKGGDEEIKKHIEKGLEIKKYLMKYLSKCKYKNLVKVKFFQMDLYSRPLCVIFLCKDLKCDKLSFENSVNYHLMKKFNLSLYNPSKINLEFNN